MPYLEVATLRENLLYKIRIRDINNIEADLKAYSDAVWHNGRAHAHNEDFRPNHDPQREIKLQSEFDPQRNRAELIQLTAGALSGALSGTGRHIRPEQIAEYVVGCAEAALDIINKK